MQKITELKLSSWSIKYTVGEKNPYMASVHWFADDWDINDQSTYEHRVQNFARLEDALGWTQKQEAL